MFKMDKKELLKKITRKKEFSQLPEKDVEFAFEKFEEKNLNDYQILKLTRQFLRKVYSSFASRKLLNIKDKDVEWVLNKHKSTKERFPHYSEIYEKIFFNINPIKISVIDLGAGVNGFSYNFFKKKINYTGVEAIGQLVELMNYFFKREEINGKAYHLSLFEINKIKELIRKQDNPKVVFLFKVIDSLEVIERDYSKKLLKEIVPLVDKVVLSFATKSLGKRSNFGAQRNWIKKFIKEEFKILDDFELGGERYVVFCRR